MKGAGGSAFAGGAGALCTEMVGAGGSALLAGGAGVGVFLDAGIFSLDAVATGASFGSGVSAGGSALFAGGAGSC